VTARTVFAVALVAVVALMGCGSSVNDPASARCNVPQQVRFGDEVDFADHVEVDVHFRCVGAVLAGTLFLPRGTGPFPAAVYVHGSGEATRWTWRVPWVGQIVRAGIAFFSYDKRGVDESQGSCCPGDQNHFNLLAADADGAVNAVGKRADIDRSRIGFLGTSQAGWIISLAVARSRHRVAFTAIADGPAVTTGEERQWSQLAGEEADNPPLLSDAQRANFTRQLDPSGYDPVPLLRRMTVPGIWVYGRLDRSQPSEKSAAILHRLRVHGKDFTVVVFPNAGHGLLDNPPTDHRAMPTLLAWIQKQVAGA